MDIIVSILAMLTGTDSGNDMPRCFFDYVGNELAVVDCVSLDSPNPYYIDSQARLHLIHEV